MQKSYQSIIVFIAIICSSCSSLKITKDSSKLCENEAIAYEENGQMFSVFIYFENSMKGQKIWLKDRNGVLFNNTLNECSHFNGAICNIFEVNNSQGVRLRINDKETLIESTTFIDYRFIIVSKR